MTAIPARLTSAQAGCARTTLFRANAQAGHALTRSAKGLKIAAMVHVPLAKHARTVRQIVGHVQTHAAMASVTRLLARVAVLVPRTAARADRPAGMASARVVKVASPVRRIAQVARRAEMGNATPENRVLRVRRTVVAQIPALQQYKPDSRCA